MRPPLKVYIAYKWTTTDKDAWVADLAADLRAAGFDAQLDVWEVRYGDSITSYMTSRIQVSSVVLFVVTPESVASVAKGGGAVNFEMEMATARRTRGDDVRLIGIYREGDALPMHLQDNRYVDFRKDDDYQESLAALIDDLHGRTRRPRISRPLDLEWVSVPAGRFRMGSEAEPGTDNVEVPAHTVTLTRGFSILKYPVTQGNWEEVLGPEANSSHFRTNPNLPAEMVSWRDAARFVAALDEADPTRTHRLPTSAEWEYCCRAGTTSAYFFGDGEGPLSAYAWMESNSMGQTHPVGRLEPNAWGLHDMLGNVWEWTSDWFEDYTALAESDPAGPAYGRYRVIRGGGWANDAECCRSAYRSAADPGLRYRGLGLRIVSTTRSGADW
ncbi:SUMF1/EgtB/PvdO family nonheme iron enzyme [Yinghuangia sp. ASG 101]|uniref:SUMF1/EgtB/PvdO family nonheme iron enzyme n=1 Tax=Yinghuangia sp. ASG 101 TaxID=2896848 RepID=UPI001E640162|nr:SUMF1/EgtB/PvdO family nonheme iron enzyme [Yinghuangia sp. ASG 101]UGQ11151.1 SUMF1/EgtB/PvdO family nonheme iron enzyme [Yinghuangia sp. ASG 101]